MERQLSHEGRWAYHRSEHWTARRHEGAAGSSSPIWTAPMQTGADWPADTSDTQAAAQPPAAPSAMKISEFVERFFGPEHVATKELSGRTHYRAILKHVLTPEEVERAFQSGAKKSKTRLNAVPGWPYLGGVRVCDVRPDHVERLIAAAWERGYSSQTVMHIRNVVRAIFAYAKLKQCFVGDNPATVVSVPDMIRKETPALTLAQVERALAAMRYPEKDVALITILTGMNVAEICGLQWKYVNLTNAWTDADGEPIPPRTIAVRQQWHFGKLDKVAQRSHYRNLTIPLRLAPILAGLRARGSFTQPDDFVLADHAGRPVGAKQIAARRLKAIGNELQMPGLSWRVFRRTHATLALEFGRQFLEHSALMRHS